MPMDSFLSIQQLFAVPLLLLLFLDKSGHCRLARKYTIKRFSATETQITTDAPFAVHSMG